MGASFRACHLAHHGWRPLFRPRTCRAVGLAEAEARQRSTGHSRSVFICVNLRPSAVKVFLRVYSCPFAVRFSQEPDKVSKIATATVPVVGIVLDKTG
jgi:hypothetical protein